MKISKHYNQSDLIKMSGYWIESITTEKLINATIVANCVLDKIVRFTSLKPKVLLVHNMYSSDYEDFIEMRYKLESKMAVVITHKDIEVIFSEIDKFLDFKIKKMIVINNSYNSAMYIEFSFSDNGRQEKPTIMLTED